VLHSFLNLLCFERTEHAGACSPLQLCEECIDCSTFSIGSIEAHTEAAPTHRYLVYTAGGIQVLCIATFGGITSVLLPMLWVDAACKIVELLPDVAVPLLSEEETDAETLLVGLVAAPPESAASPRHRSYNCK
jgi:hypothetical protein